MEHGNGRRNPPADPTWTPHAPTACSLPPPTAACAGPGEYTSPAGLGKQVVSLRPTSPSVSFGAR